VGVGLLGFEGAVEVGADEASSSQLVAE
jgi:hypothetical protein